MAVTPHQNAVDETFTLAAGNQTWKSLLATAYPGMSLQHKFFSFRVISGGPVAMAKKTMTLITDGAQYAVGEGDSEPTVRGQTVNGAAINFFATGADVIRVQASNA